jgi:putative endonuclease
MTEYAYVYILASGFRKLYIGVTTNLNLQARLFEHKQKSDPRSHTARYNINQLVYFERFATITGAIGR